MFNINLEIKSDVPLVPYIYSVHMTRAGHSEQTRWSRMKNGGLWVCHYPGGNTGPQHNGPFIPFMFVQEIITQWGTILCSSHGTLMYGAPATYLSLLQLCLALLPSTAQLVKYLIGYQFSLCTIRPKTFFIPNSKFRFISKWRSSS